MTIIEPYHEKPGFCIYENKDADQQSSNNCTANQRFCFRHGYYNPSSSQIRDFKLLLPPMTASTGQFVSDLVVNPEARPARDVAQSQDCVHRQYKKVKLSVQSSCFDLLPGSD